MKVFSVHYNKPEYIYLQKRSLDKYLKVPYEFIILDNSIDVNHSDNIKKATDELNINYVYCNNNIRSAGSVSHQNALAHFVNIINDGETVMIIDHDLFLISDLEESYYIDHDIIYLKQPRGGIIYPWPGLIIFNKVKNKSQMSFKSGMVENQPCDTGGFMYYYIRDNNLNVKNISNTKYINTDSLLMETFEDIFVHLISGSDWNKNYDLQGKLDFIKDKFIYD